MRKKSLILILMLCSSGCMAGETLTDEQRLGKLLYGDRNLSLNRNQSCASCHSLIPVLGQRNLPDEFPIKSLADSFSPELGLRETANGNRLIPFVLNLASLGQGQLVRNFPKLVPAFVDPENVRKGTAVSAGSLPHRNGTLNAPSAGYAAFSPLFHWDEEEGLYLGGQFWNGRASNLTEQAKQPFLNPVEMAMPSEWSVVSRLQENEGYKILFWQVYGLNLAAVARPKNNSANVKIPAAVKTIYQHMAKAIGAFEQTPVFNKFNSKFDYVLAGMTKFTPIEKQGSALFNDEKKGNCAACHISQSTKDEDGNVIPPLFTDFTYDNIGLPRNVKIPGNPEPNLGLGGRSDIAALDPHSNEIGKHKVMSLRNIAITPPYGHNGVFATLEQFVHFYNTRDTLGWVADNQDSGFAVSGWPDPEIPENVNRDELGDLGLTADEEKAIVAFMKTLTDDYPNWGLDRRVPPGTPSPFTRVPLPPLP
ncbi:MAG: cytochrome c peroxidase [Methylobacter sp.]|nr:cytochrome c peroxidase [Methylobacter sp.]